MYNWTEEQLRAIETKGCPIIVSAAAGSGKTAVLVERTIRLLTDEKLRIPADSLLAVTFTNDAASQMKRKLEREIDLRAEQNPESEWIQRQQALLRLAEITTINSFCLSIVRDNLPKTEFQSGLRILEENEAKMLLDRALTEVLEREYSERPKEIEELISLFCCENDTNLRNMILKLYGFLRSLPFPKLWTKHVLNDLRTGKAAEEVIKGLDDSSSEILGLISSTVDRLKNIADGLINHTAAVGVFKENCALAEDIVSLVRKSERSVILRLVNNISWRQLKQARQSKAEKAASSEIENGLYESAKDCYAHIKKLFSDLASSYCVSREDIDFDAQRTAEVLEKLFNITDRLDAELKRVKIEKNALDFADTELLCVSLLVECQEDGSIRRTDVAEEMRSRRRVILIDEFQDVNNLQEVIFKAISDTDNLSEIGRNVFVVGDVKQAIYRFRQANPKIFMQTRAQGKDPASPVRELLLRRNFRSRAAVLDFVNYVFGAIMSERVGEADYTEEEALVVGADYKSPDRPTEIIVINGDTDEEESDAEYTAVARKIRKMIDDGVEVLDGDCFRACRPSDFCVLTRTNVSGSDITDIFAAEGLKVLSSDASGYLRSREISVLLNLLSVISDPMRDIPLASVMLSPIGGFSDDDVAQLKILSSKDRLYKTALAVSKGEYNAGEALQKKCSELIALIKKLSVFSSGLTLTRLIRKVYDAVDIFSIASAYEDGEQKCANLYLLLEYARSYEQSSSDGILGFLRYIDYISRSGGDFKQALTVTESADAVVVKTIHKSKGLEYSFVFLCQMRKKFNQADFNTSLMINADYGAGLMFYDYLTLTKRKTAIWEYIKSKNSAELLSEELRLLYVAMTRAREGLFIVLDLGDATVKRAVQISYEISGYKISPALASKATCPADWLLMALMKHPEFKALRSRLDPSLYSDAGINGLPAIEVTVPPPASERISEVSDIVVKADQKLTKRITEGFRIVPDSRLTKNEAKLTVSEIVKDDALTFFPKVPDLNGSLSELSAAEKGTLTHRFMQFCRFDRAADDLGAEISRLICDGIFTPREAEAIDRKSVSKFFVSDIYRRLSMSSNVLRERRFIVRFDDIAAPEELLEIYRGTDGMLQGIADCLFEEADGYVLVDYKTDRVENLAQLKERYIAQLMLYKAAFDALLDKPVKSSFIYSFCLAAGIEVGL